MKAVLQSLKWSDRPKITKEAALLAGIALALVLAYFKLRPYFNPSPKVVVSQHHEEKAAGVATLIDHLTLNGTPPSKGTRPAHDPAPREERGRPGGNHKVPGVIERPLFDGLTVTLKAVLMNAVSSHEAGSPIEASVIELIRDETTSELDSGPAEGARLIGTMSANMASKRIGLSFSDLVSREGRTYSVSGIAVDPETKRVGVAANYSSGLGSRLLGVTLDQGLTLADQVAMAKVLERTSGDSQSTVTQMTQATSLQLNQQASTSISAEATRELRETPAELSLDAGAVITVRLKALPGGQP